MQEALDVYNVIRPYKLTNCLSGGDFLEIPVSSLDIYIYKYQHTQVANVLLQNEPFSDIVRKCDLWYFQARCRGPS
jgi:hypothetical protein